MSRALQSATSSERATQRQTMGRTQIRTRALQNVQFTRTRRRQATTATLARERARARGSFVRQSGRSESSKSYADNWILFTNTLTPRWVNVYACVSVCRLCRRLECFLRSEGRVCVWLSISKQLCFVFAFIGACRIKVIATHAHTWAHTCPCEVFYATPNVSNKINNRYNGHA